MKEKKFNKTTYRLCVTAIFMSLNIALSSFGVPVPGGKFYLCDTAICTAAILLDPAAAFAVGGIGSFLGDLFFYPAAMFVSLFVHGLQALAISLCAHGLIKSRPRLSAAIGVVIGTAIMVVGYTLGCAFVYGSPEAAIINIPYEALQSGFGAIAALLICFRFRLADYFEQTKKKWIR